jgi:hypothetical protein
MMSSAFSTRLRLVGLPIAIAASASFVGLSLQVALLRIFSIVLWHHFAAPLISLALIGNVLGLAAASWRKKGLANPVLAFLILGAVHFSLWCSLGLVRYSPFQAFVDGELALVLPLVFLLCQVLLVYFLVGFLLGNAIRMSKTELSLVYAFDLFGGLVGVLALLLLGKVINPLAMLPLQGILCFVMALMLEWTRLKDCQQRNYGKAVGCLALLAAGGAGTLRNDLELQFPQGKALYQSESRIEQTVWDPAGRIDILQPTQGIYHGMGGVAAPKSSDAFSYRLMTQDGGAPSAIMGVSEAGIEATLWRDYLQSAPFILKPQPSTLIIGPGGGLEVVLAAHFHARTIEAVDLNGSLVSLLQKDYAEYQGGLFQRENVQLIWSEGRRYLRNATEFYDVILLAGVDTFLASPGGANALAERYLYTTDAVQDSLERLSANGVLSMVRRRTSPATETYRYLTTVVQVLEQRAGPAAKDCIVLIEGPSRPGQATWVNCLVKPSGFSSREELALLSWVRTAGFHLLSRPGEQFENVYSEYLAASQAKRESMILASPLDIRPCTDDAPFFFLWAKRSQVLADLMRWLRGDFPSEEGLIIEAVPIGILSSFLLGVLLLLIGLPYMLWVTFPFRAHELRASRWGLCYFSLTGFAFLGCEISLFHLAEYVSGTPSLSFISAVGGILCGAGLGSLLGFRSKWLPLVGSILLCAEYGLWQSHLHWQSAAAGLTLVFLLAALSGFVFGALFPQGIRVFVAPNQFSRRAVFLGISSWASVVAGSLSGFLVWYWGIASLFLICAGFLLVTLGVLWAGERFHRA